MTTSIAKILFAAFLTITFISCGHDTDVVESGTYQGTVDKVVPEKKEIYVKTIEDKRLELYFTDATKLTRNGRPAEFDVLEKGQKVEVEVERVGKRLDPVSVAIQE